MSDTIKKTFGLGTDTTAAYTYCTRHHIAWDRVQFNGCPSCASEAKGGLVSEMVLRDWFAGQCQADDRLVKCIRAMDDSALELFALHPGLEREEDLTEVDLTCWAALPSEVARVKRRLELEAQAIARVRFMQADAMLAVRKEQP